MKLYAHKNIISDLEREGEEKRIFSRSAFAAQGDACRKLRRAAKRGRRSPADRHTEREVWRRRHGARGLAKAARSARFGEGGAEREVCRGRRGRAGIDGAFREKRLR